MILKVKEPLPAEYRHLREGLLVFTYLHLAASGELTKTLRAKKVGAIGYETIQLDDGSLPLLAPMSEVAGRLSIQVGSWCLQAPNGGAGILLGGASGVRPANVVILGAGIAGSQCLPDRRRGRRARQHHRPQSGAAALPARHPRWPHHHGDVEPRQHRGRSRWPPIWSSARCWSPARRRRIWSPARWCAP